MGEILREVWNRMLSLFRKGRHDADLEAESKAHLELAIEENLSRGMSPAEARRLALLRFGGVQQGERAAARSPRPAMA
jgi:hypothetical protein